MISHDFKKLCFMFSFYHNLKVNCKWFQGFSLPTFYIFIIQYSKNKMQMIFMSLLIIFDFCFFQLFIVFLILQEQNEIKYNKIKKLYKQKRAFALFAVSSFLPKNFLDWILKKFFIIKLNWNKTQFKDWIFMLSIFFVLAKCFLWLKCG